MDKARKEIEKMIPKMVRDSIVKKKQNGINISDKDIDGFPADFKLMLVSGALTSDAFYSYDLKDGDVFEYINWFIESSLRIVLNELGQKTIENSFVLANVHNFYKKIVLTFEKTHDPNLTADLLGIPAQEKYIKKCLDIYEERII